MELAKANMQSETQMIKMPTKLRHDKSCNP
jgi:hypothetical protein